MLYTLAKSNKIMGHKVCTSANPNKLYFIMNENQLMSTLCLNNNFSVENRYFCYISLQ